MLNNIEFTNRLKEIMETHQLTATLFADRIGVQRSSISHILSGRNKPSLDFVLKITAVFLDVEIQWLLHGKGEFPKTSKKINSPTLSNFNQKPTLDLFKEERKESIKKINASEIQRIVIFYKNGAFEEYNNE